MQFITNPLFAFLVWLNSITGNFGLSIILLTVIVRSALLPLTFPSLKKQMHVRTKMKEIQPKLDALKIKHKNDQKAMVAAQSALFKEHNINPLAGILPTLLQLVFLIALFQVLQRFLKVDSGLSVESLHFLGINMILPDGSFILPVLSGVSQFIFSLMLMPGLESHDLIPDKSKSKKLIDANKQETQKQDMATQMQQQTLFIMPIITGFIAIKFPAGLALYWVVTTLFSIGQQYFVSGWGGLTKYYNQGLALVSRKK